MMYLLACVYYRGTSHHRPKGVRCLLRSLTSSTSFGVSRSFLPSLPCPSWEASCSSSTSAVALCKRPKAPLRRSPKRSSLKTTRSSPSWPKGWLESIRSSSKLLRAWQVPHWRRSRASPRGHGLYRYRQRADFGALWRIHRDRRGLSYRGCGTHLLGARHGRSSGHSQWA